MSDFRERSYKILVVIGILIVTADGVVTSMILSVALHAYYIYGECMLYMTDARHILEKELVEK